MVLLVTAASAAMPAAAQSLLPGGTQPARALPVAGAPGFTRVEPGTVLRNVSILRGRTSVEVHIEASAPVKPAVMVLSRPQRIVVDLAGVGCAGGHRFPVGAGDVQDVRVALFKTDPPVTRVVVDLVRRREYRLLPAGSTVILAIDTSVGPAIAGQPAEPKMAPVTAVKSVPSESLQSSAMPSASSADARPAQDARVPAPPPGSEAKPKLPPLAVAPPEERTQPPAPSAPVPVQPSQPTASTTLPEFAALPVAANTAQLPSGPEEDETTPHQADKGRQAGVVRNLTVSREKDAIVLRIEGSKPLRASASTLSNPERIIIDLTDVRLRRPQRIAVNNADVETITASLYLVNPLVTRVVVDLAHPHGYRLQSSGNSLTVRIESNQVKAAGAPLPPGPL